MTARAGERPTWQHASDIPRCVRYRPNLVRTVSTALCVGTVLFLVNHLGTVLGGHAGTATWVGTGLSFVVPFCVSNVGLLVGSRRREPGSARTPSGPTWSHLTECPRCIAHPPYLRRTVATALAVGTGYFLVNQVAVVLAGHASTGVWVETGVTYLVPFTVSNVGLLVGCRRTPPAPALARDG